jgi:protein O-mannosyl-transferase
MQNCRFVWNCFFIYFYFQNTISVRAKNNLQKFDKSQFWLQAVILFFPVIIYFNTIGNDYALDDAMVITQNHFTQKGFAGLKDIFTTDSFTGFFNEKKVNLPGGRYRPLSIATFAVEHAFWGNNPHISHLINVLLFALTGLILFRVLRLLFQNMDVSGYLLNVPVLATLIFLAHPIHTEVVANIKGRDEILSLLFALLALFSVIKYADIKKGYWLVSAFICLFLGLLSKESAITFLLLIPLSVYFFRNIRAGKLIISSVPLLLSVIVYFMIRNSITEGFHNNSNGILMNNPFLNANGGEKLATIIFTLGLYLKLLFWPHPLTIDYYPYHIALTNFLNFKVIIALIIYCSLFIYACLIFVRKNPAAFSILFFLISIFPVSNLVVNVGTFMNERFIYQASVAFAIGIAWIILLIPWNPVFSKKRSARYLKMLLLLAIILSFSIVTWSRNYAWKNDYTLFLTDVKTSSNSAKSNCGAGGVLLDSALKTEDPVKKREELIKAVQYLTKATTIDPTYSDVWRKLGTAQYELNQDIPGAFRYYCNAIRNNPGDEDAYANIHVLMSKCDNSDNKIEFYRELLKINPKRPDVTTQLGFLYGKEKHDLPAAITFFKQSLSLNPASKEACKGLGAAYFTEGSYDESLHWLEKALALDSLDAGTNRLLGNTYLHMGNKQKADLFLTNANRLKNKNREVK